MNLLEQPHRDGAPLQKGKINVDPIPDRKLFKVGDFMKQHQLSPPMGGSYFFAKKRDELEHTGNQAPF